MSFDKVDPKLTDTKISDNKLKNTPPHNLEAEKSVLGALLLDQNAFNKVLDVGLNSEDFYLDAHKKLFEVIFDLHNKLKPVDLVTVGDALKNKGQLEAVGGLAYITSLFDDAYSAAHVSHYSKIIKEKAILRKIISLSVDILDKAYSGVDDVEDFLDYTEKSIFEVTDNNLSSNLAPIKSILIENMQTIQLMAEKKTAITGVPTGFHDFDQKTLGLHPGQLIILAARPAMGKTSLALNIAENAALQAKATVAVFSLEMSKDELGLRFLSSIAKVESQKIRTGKLQDKDWKSLAKAAASLSECKIFLDDTAYVSVLDIRSRCRRLKAEHGLDLVIIDYLQLMRGLNKNGKAESREREISEISRSLKMLAKELKLPIIALSQLNRGLEQREDKRPMLSDLRESGAIEQDADIVAFVYRDEVYNQDSPDKGIAEVIIAKHRAGSTGTVKLSWQAEFTAFGNLAQNYYHEHQPLNAQSQNTISHQKHGHFSDEAGKPSFDINKLDLPNF